jgi:hypothetical protein
VRGLPGWSFDPSIVAAKTMLVVMPYLPTDLKNLLRSARRAGAPFLPEARALRLGHRETRAIASFCCRSFPDL